MPSGDYDPDTVEPEWQRRWVETDTYAYDEDAATDPNTVFSIDTPPPTVSGSLHWGHVYGSILQDTVARFNRMRGEEVFFPFGYDDNGIASERLTEEELDIRHQEFERREFQRKCREVCEGYEAEFTAKMQDLGVSIDWDNTYRTIEPRVQRISQLSFLDLYEQGREYREKAPAIWCPECETAISQVETEDDEQDSHFHDIAFALAGSDGDADGDAETFTISTTRPELLPACVAVFVHPDDDDNQSLVGESAEVPLFGQEVPIIADDRVDMETGSGVVMCCTFGDQNDIEWYQAHDLDLRVAIDESGHMTEEAGEYEGLHSGEAREAIVSDLDDAGALLDRRAITHTVNVHERCGTPVEFLVTEQWYVELLDRKEEYLDAGREMDWYPEKMFTRYEHWIEGLQWDWLISRQRSSGIPFPVWYCADCDEPVMADRADLPVDPLSDDPPADACPACGHDEFVPEDDVLDTWATSSLTPLINAGWDWDDDAGEFTMERPELYRFDVRPQGHDIISFWLFHTVVKCYEHTGETPFDSVMINGMVLDENREKMSKSKGNVVAPDEVLAEYPVDAARFWATGSAVGDDLPYQEKGLRAGEKLMQKLWNASKLIDSLTPETDPDVDEGDLRELDRWLLAELDDEVERATDLFEQRAFSKVRDGLRSFFWHTFCDDYLEVAKTRVREAEDGDPAAAYTLRVAHRRFLKLFAPFLAHETEELWSEMYAEADVGDGGSVHRAEWPEPLGVDADRAAGRTAMAVVGALRRYKSERGLPLNAELDRVEVYGEGDVASFADDVRGVMNVADLDVLAEAPEIETVVSGVDLDYSKVGPEFGSKVGDIDAGIESGEYELADGELRVAGETLGADLFEVERERRYAGEGDLLEAEDTDAVVIVHDE
ncbi:valine--tRNA ligase [Candidatus Halobonum tyrrellensis]|uniref:Valine--tRNA ligase n=1 Tax=Candidatus Halobonum tyrrellensis G22 TaxID=1324957 RepID=V4HD28_9EURY|nr:valine--tRNA ligase [Candidatus Halobonum tyrrellensis]ESP87968.1 valyl-tRNA ligase [Candidatus Halobonum tyrrellensis G22]